MAAAPSPVASPNRRKVVVTAAPAEPAQLQQQQPTRESSDPDSGELPASQTYGDPDAKGLSQLSDLADLGSEPGPGASQYKLPTSAQMAINSQSQVPVEHVLHPCILLCCLTRTRTSVCSSLDLQRCLSTTLTWEDALQRRQWQLSYVTIAMTM